MTLGEFRELTKDLPDDTDLLIEPEPYEFHELSHKWTLPPVLEHSFALWLSYGQEVTEDLDMDARVDATFGL